MAERFDAVVVGAGPAGSMAALVLARRGRSVCLIERGPFAGAKNLYGGVVYPRVLDSLLPGWADEAPLERFVTRRVTAILSGERATLLDVRSPAWGRPPYNGATALRPAFDSYLALKAEEAGAEVVFSTTVTSLRRGPSGKVTGVVTDRPDGEVEAGIVVCCDGVNAFLAKEAGLVAKPQPGQYTLGVKEVLHLGATEIERRFQLGPKEGADYEVLGATGEVAGGGFLYTNKETVSVGLVLSVEGLSRSDKRPEELLSSFKSHPAIAPLVAGGELVEYGAHLIPEAGIEMLPKLAGDGILVAGDAAGLCLAAGLFLEGVNFAMASGAAAGEAAADALEAGDTSRRGLAGYEKALSSSFVLRDLRKMRRAPRLVMSDRVQWRYPELVCGLMEELFTVTNPSPKPGIYRLFRRQMRSGRVKARQLLADGVRALRSFG